MLITWAFSFWGVVVVVEDCCEGGALLLVLGEDTVGEEDAIVSEGFVDKLVRWWEYHRTTIPYYLICR